MIAVETVNVKWNGANRKHYESLGYHFTKNGDEFTVKVEHLPPSSEIRIPYICNYCNGNKQRVKTKMNKDLTAHRKNTPKDCCDHKDCISAKRLETNNKKVIPIELSVQVMFPELALEWDFSMNDKPPSEHLAYSHKYAWWICQKKGHSFDMKISDRTNLNASCPYCAGKRVNEDNCLATNFPHLVKEWHPTLNNGVTPRDVVSFSNKSYWWVCEKKHEWLVSVNNRTGNGTNCPYCSGLRVCLENCLATTHPELTKEWHPTLNEDLTPFNVSYGQSKHKIWWKCAKCSHEWKCLLLSRSISGTGCPVCSETKGEKKVRGFLESHSLNFLPQYEFENLLGINGGLLKFDFALLNDLNPALLVEYDGEFHFRKIYDDDGHETTVEHDKRKDRFCEENNIPLLRIPYWQFDEIEEILNKYFTKNNLFVYKKELD